MLTHTSPASVLDSGLLDLLLQAKILTEDQLFALDDQAKGNEEAFERLLLDGGYLMEEQLGQIKAEALGWNFVDLTMEPIKEEDLRLLPRAFAEAQRVVPFRKSGRGEICVAMANPGNGALRRLLQKKFGQETRVFFAMGSALATALSHYETGFTEHCEAILRLHQDAMEKKNVDDHSVVQLVEALLLHGVRHKASDVHIEPNAHDTVVRERTDGMLRKTLRFSKEAHALVVLRIKVLANLATDEHMAPQDGKFMYMAPGEKRVDIRVSIIATTHGEKIVMRLLAAQDQALFLESIGLMGKDLTLLQEEMDRSWGMILVTGPTGSGKTTTLYSVLRILNSDDVNIATIEDPVEYDLPGANQIQVNETVGVTFATGLRSIVRQDPDTILVGEIRDTETANISVNAAMTGHLVLSTLHTNNAATAIPRLIDMDTEPFLISSTVNVIIAQRLVRSICERCRESREIDVADLSKTFPIAILEKLARKREKIRVFHGKGCDLCGGSGYMGRKGIFEVLRIDQSIRDLIMQHADADRIHKAAVKGGMTTMMDDGIEKVLQGMTTIEEVLRVIRS